jgi:hypothetical protein
VNQPGELGQVCRVQELELGFGGGFGHHGSMIPDKLFGRSYGFS